MAGETSKYYHDKPENTDKFWLSPKYTIVHAPHCEPAAGTTRPLVRSLGVPPQGAGEEGGYGRWAHTGLMDGWIWKHWANVWVDLDNK